MTAGIGVLLSTLAVAALMLYLTKLSYKDNLNISTSKMMKKRKFCSEVQ